MNIRIIAVGKLKEDFYTAAQSEFTKRLSKYANVTITEVKDERADPGQEDIARAAEAERIFKNIKDKEYVIALEIRGKEYDSEGFANMLHRLMVSGVSDIVFIIGGSTGLDKRVAARANASVSFSKLTFSHQMMRQILLEQLFRAFKIINGETYHK
ncbi:MAG TPA: 23S rRNA (pseudouridine(1915)-N(3))-methyltransferase RlmH [Clostridia bacterium]|nr:23S rRNA (pseudouridine(1915)-N(3))-methyltransferase RlmH [Clostridia bacterium]